MAGFEQFGQAKPEAPAKQEAKKMEQTPLSFSKKDLQGPSLYAPIPEGKYTFTVYDCQTDHTKKDGTPMKVVILEIEYEESKVRVTDYLVLKASMQWKIGRFFASIGLWDELEEKGLKGVADPIWDAAVGREGEVETKHDVYKDKVSNKVKNYIVPGTLAVR